jgi:hypothetical protein
MTADSEGFLTQEIVEVQHAPRELSFRAGARIVELVREWERSNDELVFKTQLETGSFHGQLRVDDPAQQELMRRAADHGQILPYYGAGGSGGACRFKFLPGATRCLFEVEHGVTGATLAHEAEAQPADAGEDQPGQAGGELLCRIAGGEYQALRRWEHWLPDEALAERYWYEFGQVSMGRQGLTVHVLDTRSGERLDATDYETW